LFLKPLLALVQWRWKPVTGMGIQRIIVFAIFGGTTQLQTVRIRCGTEPNQGARRAAALFLIENKSFIYAKKRIPRELWQGYLE
jgi:hypothetical protein